LSKGSGPEEREDQIKGKKSHLLLYLGNEKKNADSGQGLGTFLTERKKEKQHQMKEPRK